MATKKTKDNFKVGDFVFYQFLAKDYVKGKILELKDKVALIEIGFCTKKSEDVKTETMDVEYKYLYSVEEFIKMNEKSTKNVIK